MHTSELSRRIVPLIGAGLFVAAPLRADTVTFSVTHAMSPTNWTDQLLLPKFDKTMGVLNSVELTLLTDFSADARVENLTAASASVTTSVTVAYSLIVGSFFNSSLATTANETTTLAAFDGVPDFGGASGITYLGLSQSGGQIHPFTPPSLDFDLFRGGPGDLVTCDLSATMTASATGATNLAFQASATATASVTVVYDFTPIVFVDCNGNGIDDAVDLSAGTSLDCDANSVPDECDPDCGTNGIPDACEPDTDGDGIPDDCDVPPGACDPVGRRNPGSLLLYPEFDNRAGNLTLVTVTNTNCDFSPVGTLYAGTVDVEFVYVGRYGLGGRDLSCLEFNRTHRLSPCDTLTVYTSAHNPAQERGYLYLFAKSPQTGQAIVFNHLIGQELLLGGTSSSNDSMNAVAFAGVGSVATPTDHDSDGIRDLDGAEYSEAPDELLIPRFFGQDSVGSGLFHSRLILIGLSGGTSFTTTVRFLIYNDNEEEFSAAYTFECWASPYLAQINGAFLESYLDGTTNDPAEILGAAGHEAGWFRIDGDVAQSTAHAINDPAIYAVLVENAGTYSVADLPFELCTQSNGDLLPTGVFGDNGN